MHKRKAYVPDANSDLHDIVQVHSCPVIDAIWQSRTEKCSFDVRFVTCLVNCGHLHKTIQCVIKHINWFSRAFFGKKGRTEQAIKIFLIVSTGHWQAKKLTCSLNPSFPSSNSLSASSRTSHSTLQHNNYLNVKTNKTNWNHFKREAWQTCDPQSSVQIGIQKG